MRSPTRLRKRVTGGSFAWMSKAASSFHSECSLISWTHNTQNFWVGCDKVAPECAKCYIGREIRKQSDWQGGGPRKSWGEVYLTKTWEAPYRCEAELKQGKQAKRIFTCSLSDFFHAKVDDRTVLAKVPAVLPIVGGETIAVREAPRKEHFRPAFDCGSFRWRDCAWQVIKDTPHLVYLILTKRPELIPARLPKDWGQGYPNVWLGTSVGCNQTLSKIDSLRRVPIHPDAVRFISAEPLLEDISENINLDGIGWLIAGGESGTNPEYVWDASADWREEMKSGEGRRYMDVAWAWRLQRLAHREGIPFYFKQITSGRQHVGMDALGKIYREYPAPPKGMIWMPENAEIKMPHQQLVVLQ